MDHEQATSMHAAERYLLKELSPEQTTDFEEHYFECVDCADEVRSAFAFADNAKSVQSQHARSETERTALAQSRPRVSWLERLWRTVLKPDFGLAIAAPVAAVLLLGFTLYQQALVIPRLQRDLETLTQPRVVPTIFAHAATRGEDPVVEIGENDRFFQLILDINATVPVSSYLCKVYDESSTLRFAVPAPAPSGGGALNLLLPASGLNAGRYTINVTPLIDGDSKTELQPDQYSFVLRRK
jgi:hypothetical protein